MGLSSAATFREEDYSGLGSDTRTKAWAMPDKLKGKKVNVAADSS